jgi:hypothetical protein
VTISVNDLFTNESDIIKSARKEGVPEHLRHTIHVCLPLPDSCGLSYAASVFNMIIDPQHIGYLRIHLRCKNFTAVKIHTVTYRGLAWLIIMGSGFDDWVYWHFFTFALDYESSHVELLWMPYEEPLWRISHESLTNFRLTSTATCIHESTAFCGFHAARIEVTAFK